MTASHPYFPADAYDGVVIFDGPDVPLAVVEVRDYPMARMPELMDAVFSELFPALASAGTAPAGPALAMHTRVPTDTVDMAVGVPVTAPLTESLDLGDGHTVVASSIPAGRVAATSHLGSYDGLGDAWGRFMGDVASAGHTPTTRFFEVYVTEPTPDADPATMRTDLAVFLA
ncbi:GyrI-like domain-containing protein [Tomitella fengzijianii]|uniref:AraC family transcriptional regulator n=1 Tax=Tomitella fengzijianii TaxID=2597660 RepID=A0A516X1P5_9ACTN|nr:GyrI-like domain-containing protein [Tomitella fengzijianii]QDQ96947.1 AraC family transcriptional regulator [Tomitella fengzijianii]